MRSHHRDAGAIEINLAAWFVELQQAVLPMFPVPDVVLAQFVVGLEQAGARVLSRLRPDPAEAQRQGEFPVACCQIDLAGERDVSVFRAGVVPGHLVMLGEVLPSVGESRQTRLTSFASGTEQIKARAVDVALGKQRGRAFVIPDPSGIFPARNWPDGATAARTDDSRLACPASGTKRILCSTTLR